MEDHPDIALAIMGEDLPPNYVGPPDLLGKFNVEIPSEARRDWYYYLVFHSRR